MTSFWIGLLIGVFAGGTLGALTMAIMAVGKDSNFWPPRADEIIDLNENDHGIAPGSEDHPRRYVADRFYREKDHSDHQTYRR
ncbi:hypothetical protein ACVMGC_001068 [Bradyrhizobium barranii subsp. barranii]|uniref:hypothetical protein n=1 Tax=Bradyrhizobium TaxID=374 RepID=UPI001BA55D93|nr:MULTISPECIES: hypothetical protein [Bradyrhizobium]MBR0879666.1 hypothetical protein [Bradyrhizobium liaoningense]MCP1778779.1 hypothetical protein [Bradyrhizobium japonicum]MCP1958223.1 hypothetical protein [Bradyrhizobium japonicum]